MTLIEELGLVETALGDLAAFAAGQPVSGSATIAGKKLAVSVVHLGATPGTDYQVFSGGILQMLTLALTDGAELAAGVPVKIAEKIGNSWYGETLSLS